MREIEKMQQYIAQTNADANGEHGLIWNEMAELCEEAHKTDFLMEVIALAFNYGKAKGYRAAKAEAQP